jgi:hypothetical protein
MPRCRAELLLIAALAGCDVEGSIGFGTHPGPPVWIDLEVAPHHDVDVLVVVDNTAAMAPRQQALVAALGGFTNQLFGPAGRQFHFGVITTDLGAGKAVGQCVAPGGDGVLVDVGSGAPAGCLGPTGARWLSWGDRGDNLPAGQDVPQTLGCMLQVGVTGCGFPQPLEAANRALHNPANSGFLRDDSLLVIIFVTDGDDCSAPPDSPVFDGPLDRFRCTSAAVECGNPPHPPMPDPNGPLEDCAPRNGGGLYDLDRYRQLFFLTSGVRSNPNDVLLGLFAGPAMPFSVTLDGNGDPQLQPSCVSADDSGQTALPALRLQSLVQGSPRSVIADLCTPGASQYFLGSLAGDVIKNDPGAACLPAPLADPSRPSCEVSEGDQPIPDCVTSANATPCWQIANVETCLPIYDPRTDQYQQLAVAVRPLPPRGVTARCLVLPP